jgi:hypothetical protein
VLAFAQISGEKQTCCTRGKKISVLSVPLVVSSFFRRLSVNLDQLINLLLDRRGGVDVGFLQVAPGQDRSSERDNAGRNLQQSSM